MVKEVTRIVGVGYTAIGRLGKPSPTLILEALHKALGNANMKLTDLDAVVAVPSMSAGRFMMAHFIATISGLTSQKADLVLRTIDTGGAGPISALGIAKDFIEKRWAKTVAVIGGDAVLSMPTEEFLRNVNPAEDDSQRWGIPVPIVPNAYDRYAQFHMRHYGLKREQLAMVPALMSVMAARHPDAMCRRAESIESILQSRQVAPATTLLECARRADGAAAIILSAESHYRQHVSTEKLDHTKPVVMGIGEAGSSMFPPPLDAIKPGFYSCARAAQQAYRDAQVTVSDVGFFGLYDCFPICLIRALEEVGVCPEGQGGAHMEAAYTRMMTNGGTIESKDFPINTHGGLLCFGAPWEVPAIYNITEAVAQLAGNAGERQIVPTPKIALTYGNGGVFSASAVAILGSGN